MGMMHVRCGTTNMFKKSQNSILNIIENEDFPNDDHWNTSNVKEKIQWWITMFPVTQKLKNRDGSNDMKMSSKLLK